VLLNLLSAVAEPTFYSDHRMKFHETEVLAKTSGYTLRLITEEIGIIFHADSMKDLLELKPWNFSTILLRHSNTHHETPKKSHSRTILKKLFVGNQNYIHSIS
jgi:hypothetical protein